MYHFHIQKFIYWIILSFIQTESIVSGKHYGIFGDPVLCQRCLLVPYTKALQIYGHISNVRRSPKISPWLCVNNSLQENHHNFSMTLCQKFITRKPPTVLHDFMSTIHYKRTNKTLTLCHQFIMRENPHYPSHLSSWNLQLHHFLHHFGTSIKQLNCVTAFLSVFSVASGLMLSFRIIFLHAPLKIHVCKTLRHPLEWVTILLSSPWYGILWFHIPVLNYFDLYIGSIEFQLKFPRQE